MAYRQLGGLLSRRVLPNLFDLCGPYQADGNYGATGGIAETLLQSHTKHEGLYVIELLPALPKAWPTGSVNGLRARGGFEVDIQWSNGQLTKATIHRIGDQPILLRTPRGIEQINCNKGQAISLDGDFDTNRPIPNHVSSDEDARSRR